jgi:hypothetical protein
MKVTSPKSAMLILFTVMAYLNTVSNAVYFYAAKNKWRCFADTVVKNNVSLNHSMQCSAK